MESCPDVLVLVSDPYEETNYVGLSAISQESTSNSQQAEHKGSCQREAQHSVEEERMLYLSAASKIRKLGRKLGLSEECSNTAIVYMHKFHLHHSLKKLSIHIVAIATIVLAIKIAEYDDQRSFVEILTSARACFHPKEPALDTKSQLFINLRDESLRFERELLIALELKIRVLLPHGYVKQICRFVEAENDLMTASLFLADLSLCLTSMISRYGAKILACACFHLACIWTQYKIKSMTEGREWFYYVERTLTREHLNNLTEQLFQVLQSIPESLRQRIFTVS